MKPIILRPTCKDYIWGGKKLIQGWGKATDREVIAETWELSCHKDGASYLKDNTTLADALKANPDWIGEKGKAFDNFPILIKLIDSASNLSIQVHPDDEYALTNEGQYGKTEMWYIVEAEEGAGVYCGFKEPIDKDTVRDMLNNGTICDALNFIKVKSGDVLFIKAGTVHAICGGLLICEIQQNSSLTYRLYDYDRTDANGNKRELHIDKSLDVIDSNTVSAPNSTVTEIAKGYKKLAECKYFTVYEVTGKSFIDKVTKDSFTALNFLADGSIEYNGILYHIDKGETVFLPAGFGEYRLVGDDLRVIKTTL